MTGAEPVPVVAIDGPSGSGKGAISQWLARRLGWHLLDSGALYRLVAVAATRSGIALDDVDAVTQTARTLDADFDADGDDGVRTYLAGIDVSLELRTETTGRAASQVAAYPAVRAALLERQRRFRRPPGLVADGRDMGTVVFTDAAAKIFLTASARARAERRHKQLNQKGIGANLAALLTEIRARDERDENRAASPLKPAADALVLDTTAMNIDAVCAAVLTHVKNAGLG